MAENQVRAPGRFRPRPQTPRLDGLVTASDPVERDGSPLCRAVLPGEMAGVQERQRAVRQALVKVLGVHRGNERIALTRDDLDRRLDSRQHRRQLGELGR